MKETIMEHVPYRRLPVAAAMLGADAQATPSQQQQAGGKRYKFQGSTISVLTGYHGGSPLLDITAATNANPCVIAVAAHGRSIGDVVSIVEVVGMTELNGSSYIVSAVPDAGHLTLFNTDATAYGTYVSGGKLDYATFSNFCELTNYDRTGATSPTIPATSLCSVAEEYEVGLPGSGTTKIDFNFAPQTAIQLAISTFNTSKALMAVLVVLPNSGGKRVQLGFIQQTGEKAAVGGLWLGSLQILNTGPYFDFT
jgi:hypothetical protein